MNHQINSFWSQIHYVWERNDVSVWNCWFVMKGWNESRPLDLRMVCCRWIKSSIRTKSILLSKECNATTIKVNLLCVCFFFFVSLFAAPTPYQEYQHRCLSCGKDKFFPNIERHCNLGLASKYYTLKAFCWQINFEGFIDSLEKLLTACGAWESPGNHLSW